MALNAADVVFSQDMVLDQEAFQTAADDYRALGVQLEKLKQDVVSMLEILKHGFDTPAGRKFIRSCESHLLQPLDDQKLVLEHISQILQMSRQKYDSVFQEYEALQLVIRRPISSVPGF